MRIGENQVSEEKRVLHVLGNLRRGGVEKLLLTVYRELEQNNIRFDVITRGENIPDVVDEIVKRGGKVFEMPEFPRYIVKNYIRMKRFFKEHGNKYRVIHVHANSLLYVLPLRLAKKYGIPVRILHSHNTQPAKKRYRILHYINRVRIGKSVTGKVACSAEAGRWMFGKKDFTQIRNAIAVSDYVYNKEVRERMREKFRVNDKVVLGTVGRLEQQKNQFFLLDVFSEVKKRKDAVLLIIGEGTLEEKLKQYAKEKGVCKDVLFLKNVSNVNEYLQMMDVFVLPSLYEGLGIAAIEAQTAGVPAVLSDRVPSEAVLVPENVRRIGLDDPKKWAEVVTDSILRTDAMRKSWVQKVAECGYDSKTESKKWVNMYEM